MERQNILDDISKHLSHLANLVKSKNRAGKYDINKDCENYFIPILNQIFDANFINLNRLETNAKAIDLIDQEKKISVQVSSNRKIDKVKDCIKKFISRDEYDLNYDLYFFVIQEKQDNYTQTSIDTCISEGVTEASKAKNPNFQFDANGENIFDIFDLYKLLENSRATLDDLRELENHLAARESLIKHHYSKHFEDRLDKNKTKSWLNQYHNSFIGREEELGKLDLFVSDPDRKITVINADPGYGKTRLCLEYFQKNGSNAYVLDGNLLEVLQKVDDQSLRIEHIFFIDDIDRKTIDFLEQAINTVKRLANAKLILTARKTFQFLNNKRAVSQLSDVDLNNTIELSTLSGEEAEELFRNFLNEYQYADAHFPERLALESRGIPFLIMLFFEQIASGKGMSKILENPTLLDFIKEYRLKTVEKLQEEHSCNNKATERVMTLIALLSPIKSQELLSISESLYQYDKNDTEEIIEHLVSDSGFAYNLDEGIVFKPDTYSDAIIITSSPSILKSVLQGESVKPHLTNAIRNIMRIEGLEESTKINTEVLIKNFIDSLIAKKKVDSYDEALNLIINLRALNHLSYVKPGLSIYIARELAPFLFESNYLSSEDGSYQKQSIIESIRDMLSIAALNISSLVEYESLYQVLLEYVQHLKEDFDIFKKSLGYKKYDFPEYGYNTSKEPYQRQKFLLKKAQNLSQKESLSNFDIETILVSVDILLDLSFKGDTFYNPYKGTITWEDDLRVPSNDSIRKIRLDSIELLMNLHKNQRKHELSSNILTLILNPFRFMAKPCKKGRPTFDQSKELEMVCAFIKELVTNSVSMEEKSQVINSLKLYERREIKDEYKELWNELLELCSCTNSLKEELYLTCLSNKYEFSDDLHKTLSNVIDKYQENWNELFEDLIDLSDNLIKISSGINSNILVPILEIINSKSPRHAKDFYELIRSNYPDKCLNFVELIKANYRDKDYFYKCVDGLLERERHKAHETVAWLLINARDSEQYTESDFEYFDIIVKEKSFQPISRLSTFIYPYLYAAPQKTLSLLEEICKLKDINVFAEYDIVDKIGFYLFSDKKINQDFKDLLKDFLFQKLLPIMGIESHHINRALEFLHNNFDFQTVVDFMMKKIDIMDRKELLSLPDPYNRYNNKEIPKEDEENDFIKLLNMCLIDKNFSFSKYELLFRKFAPGDIVGGSSIRITASLIEKLREWQLSLDTKNADAFIQIGEILASIYSTHDEELCKYLIDLANLVDQESVESSMENIETIFGFEFINNMGFMKSKSHGDKAYPIDIEKKNILQRLLKNHEMTVRVKAVIEKALDSVNHSIKVVADEVASEQW